MATRQQLLAQPRSGVTAGATRGGIASGSPAPPAPAASSTTATPSTTSTTPSPSTSTSTAPAASPATARPSTSSTSSTPRGSGKPVTATVTEQGAGLLVALFAWPLGVNLLRGGPPRMWGWIKAKFINQPYTGVAPAAAAAGPAGTRQKR